jgi:hypothetical protein
MTDTDTSSSSIPGVGTDDEELVARGERFVEIAAAFLVAVSLVGIGYYIARLGTGKLPQQAVRLLLTAGLAYALVRGKRWARWITVLLTVLTFVVVLPTVARSVFRDIPALESVGLLALLVGYGVIGRGLLYSRSIRAFFAARDPGHRSPVPPVT